MFVVFIVTNDPKIYQMTVHRGINWLPRLDIRRTDDGRPGEPRFIQFRLAAAFSFFPDHLAPSLATSTRQQLLSALLYPLFTVSQDQSPRLQLRPTRKLTARAIFIVLSFLFLSFAVSFRKSWTENSTSSMGN